MVFRSDNVSKGEVLIIFTAENTRNRDLGFKIFHYAELWFKIDYKILRNAKFYLVFNMHIVLFVFVPVSQPL